MDSERSHAKGPVCFEVVLYKGNEKVHLLGRHEAEFSHVYIIYRFTSIT